MDDRKMMLIWGREMKEEKLELISLIFKRRQDSWCLISTGMRIRRIS
jgi:hypothetical protein